MYRWIPAALAFLSVAAAQDAGPAPLGQLIDVGGYRVHLYCTGMGSPTVVVAGGGFSFDWTIVQTEVAKLTRICTYDPSGTAWSDPGPEPNCSGRVEELHSLLRAASVEPPYVVAGLSVGALVARLYARRHPREIVGAIMVDHAFLDVGGDANPPSVPGLDSPPVLIYKEPINLTAEETSDFRELPQRVQELHHWAMSLNPKLPTVETAEDCLAQIGGDSLGRRPLAVVSTANDHPNYKKLQQQLLALSARSRQFLADRSFHSVEIDQPDVVVAAIQWVFEAVREP
jgi:pimeloyl-ACP methyl ester carboxylesterase